MINLYEDDNNYNVIRKSKLYFLQSSQNNLYLRIHEHSYLEREKMGTYPVYGQNKTNCTFNLMQIVYIKK